MTREDHVTALLSEGNPVPDPDALTRDGFDAAGYLEAIAAREAGVVDLDRITTPRRRWAQRVAWRPATALVVASTLAVLVWIASAVTSDGEDAVQDLATRSMATVEEWERTYNAGDVEAHLALFTENAVVQGQLLRLSSQFGEDLAWEFSWDPVAELDRCWEVRTDTIICDYVIVDDFVRELGMANHGVVEFGLDPVEEYRIARITFRQQGEELSRFFAEFEAWVERTHPDVRLNGLNPSRDRDEWIRLRDEFLAVSPDYPVADQG